MAYFAKTQTTNNPDLDEVVDVIRIEEQELQSGLWGDPSVFVQGSYNTHGGIYYIPNTYPPVEDPDQSKALRANYPGIGYTYDKVNDVFYAPQPYPSWTIGPPTWQWQPPNPPGPIPQDGKCYTWDESTISWVEVPCPPGA